MGTASLPMYDLPEVAAATDAWWRAIAAALERQGVEDAPRRLARGVDTVRLWRAPDLLFSQTCGYPLTHAFKDRLRVIVTPTYDAPGCEGARYCSLIVVRRDDPARELEDLRGRTAAVTHRTSHSGYSALRAAVAHLARRGRFFGQVVESGAHAASLSLLAAGEVDVCAADCVAYALLERHRPASLERLRVLARSPSAPGLPYVTRGDADEALRARLRGAVFAALEDPGLAATREALLIAGAEVLCESEYQRIVELEQRAEALGYAQVA